MSAAWTVAGCWAGRREVLGVSSRVCWVRLWFLPAGLSWCLRVVGAPFMTPAAARRRQDVGRMDSRGCWACRRGCVGSACGFALSGDGRHKWRPYVWCGGDEVVGRRWWMLGGPPRACWVRLWFRPVGLSWCLRVVGAPFMTPVAARRRQDVSRTDSRGCWACRRECVGSVCGFSLPGDGRHKWRPYVWCGGDGVVGRRWWMLGEPSRVCSVGVPVFPAAASVGSGAAAVWTGQ